MPDDTKIQVTEEQLVELLADENPKIEELEKYFLIDRSQPFSYDLELRPQVKVVDPEDTEAFGLVSDAGIGIANYLARRSRRKRYEKNLTDHPERKRIVSEGDSWFQHPLVKDTIDHLFNHYNVLSLGAAGDLLTSMFQRAEYRNAIGHENPDFFLISGGGNDMMGGQFGDYLKDAPQPGSDPGRFLNQRFHDKLENLLRVYDTMFRQLGNEFPSLPVVCHGYDYVRPGDGKDGKWLGRPLEDHGITDEAEKRAVVGHIIDLFNERLGNLATSHANVVHVDARNRVSADQWYDEIHPNDLGFQQVALEFMTKLDA